MDPRKGTKMYERILVPIDGSDTATSGLDEAIKLAKITGARLSLLHVLDALSHASGFETFDTYSNSVIPNMRRAGQAILDRGQARAAEAGVPVETQLCESMAQRLSDIVAEQASQWRADLIVLGTHGRRGLGRFLLGSDAEQILRTSTIPVLLVRHERV